MTTDLKTLIEKRFEFKKDFYNQALSSSVFCVFLRSMISRGEAKDLAMQCLDDQHNQLTSEVLPVLLDVVSALEESKEFTQDVLARVNQAISTDCDKCDYQCQGCIRSVDDAETNKKKIEQALERLRKWSESK